MNRALPALPGTLGAEASHQEPRKSHKYFSDRDFTDLQVLSQLAWFDEFFLQRARDSGAGRKGVDTP